MTAVEFDSLIESLTRYLAHNRSSVMREERIHDGIATGLSELGVEFEREYRLTPKSRLDFFLPETGTAVEVKRGNAKYDSLRQVGRYLEHLKITGCLMIAMRIDRRIPPVFQKKPIAKLELWRILL